MGQYYMPVILDQKNNVLATAYSHEFNNGLKLMEHSWMTNEFVRAFETLLIADGPVRVVWAGDYADPEVNEDGSVRLSFNDDGSTYEANLYHLANELTPYRPDISTWNVTNNYSWYTASGQRRKEPKITRGKYDENLKPNAWPKEVPSMSSHPYLVNHDKGLFVDKRRVPKSNATWMGDDGWRIHPLPLLTVEGNGRGGGDFHTDAEYFRTGGNQGNFKLIGSWARDRLSLAKTLPKGFDRVDFDLTEA